MNPAMIMFLLAAGGTALYLAYANQGNLFGPNQTTSDGIAFSPEQLPLIDQATQTFKQLFMGYQMNPSQTILDYIRGTETFSPTPYLDPAGNTNNQYSIGYGHQIQPGDPYWHPVYNPNGWKAINQTQAETQFEVDVNSVADVVRRLVTVPLSQGQFDALTDFVYNVGQANFASSTLLQLINQGDYASAANEFDKWIHAGGVVNAGLVARRAADKNLFLTA